MASVLRGVLFAAVALIAVFAFIRIDFWPGATAPNPAWAPSEAERMKIATPVAEKSSPEPPAATRQNQSALSQKQPGTKSQAAMQRTIAQPLAAKTTLPPNDSGPSDAAPGASPNLTPNAGNTPNDVLDAEPPAPGATASGRKPGEEKALHKRIFRAVGGIFKSKKTDPKVEPSAHHPEP